MPHIFSQHLYIPISQKEVVHIFGNTWANQWGREGLGLEESPCGPSE